MVLIHDDNLVGLDVLHTIFLLIVVSILVCSARCIDRVCSGFFAKDSAGSVE
jgi:hypothetical protein